MAEKDVQNQSNGTETVSAPQEPAEEAADPTQALRPEEDPEWDAVQELKRATERLAEVEDRLLRTAAEYQNYRRRTEEQKRTWARQGREEVLVPILDVYDDFRRSLEAVDLSAEENPDAAAVTSWMQGISLIYEKFSRAMARAGVEPIEAVGHPFDPDLHDALLRQPAPPDTESGTVLAEVQRGYRLNDRILRHAQVVVAE